MLDLHTRLRTLDRPALLVRAARHGLAEADQAALMRRLFRFETPPASPAGLALVLMEMEAEAEQARIERDPAYTFAKHIEVLVALMGAARVLAAMGPREAPQEG